MHTYRITYMHSHTYTHTRVHTHTRTVDEPCSITFERILSRGDGVRVHTVTAYTVAVLSPLRSRSQS